MNKNRDGLASSYRLFSMQEQHTEMVVFHCPASLPKLVFGIFFVGF